jgi:hypothetical protein
MGIIELVGRGLGCESCGIVSAAGATAFRSRMLFQHQTTRFERLIS